MGLGGRLGGLPRQCAHWLAMTGKIETMEDVLMSEFEKDVNEMDAADVVAAAQEADRKRMVPVEPHAEDQTEGRSNEHWDAEMIREFEDNAKRWHRRQGWEAFYLACYHGLTVLACAGAMLGGPWELILASIGISNLIMMGGWLHKAKAGWGV